MFLSKTKILILVLIVSGCAHLPFIQRIKPEQNTADDRSRIISYYVVHNAPDHLALAVKYFYEGDKGDDVSLGAITLSKGKSNGYWSYRAAPAGLGENWAHIYIGINETAPAEYDSDEIQFSIYKNGASEFQHAVVPFRKHWQKLEKPSTCHLEWGKGCG